MHEVTLRQVTAQVELHPVTVSRILAGTYAGSVETTALVRQVAKDQGYHQPVCQGDAWALTTFLPFVALP